MKNLKTILLVITSLCFIQVKAQDIHFSQYFNTPTFFNPATAGVFRGDHRASLHYRSQWGNVGSGNKTYGLSYDTNLKGKNSRKDNFFGVGITAYGDKSGENNLKQTSVNGLVSYNVRMGKGSFLSLGVNTGFNQYSLDQSTGIWDSQYDGVSYNPNLPTGEAASASSFSSLNLGSGILWSYSAGSLTSTIKDRKTIQLGASFSHIIQSEHSYIGNADETLDFKYVIHGNSLFDLGNTNVAIQPSFLFQKQGPSNEIVVGSLIKYQTKESSRFTGLINQSAVYIGLYYRFQDAIIPTIQYEKSYFLFALSYDINLSEFTSATSGNGGFELSIKFVTPSQLRTRKSSARFM